MAKFNKMVITRAGLDMIAQSQAGGTLIFTKAKLGDGQIEEESIPDLTDLVNSKMDAQISTVTAKAEGHVEIKFIVDNQELDVGFFVREVGIFAKVNDEGVEQLYGYANAGNYTNYLSDKDTPIDSIITKLDLVVGNASSVAFTNDKSIVYVTLEDMENALNTHDDNADAHEPAFAAHNADGNAHKDMVGATSGVAGKRGMVPAPAAGTANRYLKADGTWGTIDTMNGASSSESGSEGLVPAPTAGTQNKFLRGDGTWADAKMSTKELVDILYPVGHIYMSTNSANPGTLFPGTTWEAYAQGRVLIGAGTGTDSRSEKKTFAAGSTGGEYNHQLTVGELASHNHSASTNSASLTGAIDTTDNNTNDRRIGTGDASGILSSRETASVMRYGDGGFVSASTGISINASHSHSVTVNSNGSNTAHNNTQPYITAYIWRRTA
nr:MAG TPA: Baseplate structural protein [Caudoviricetes sp.]